MKPEALSIDTAVISIIKVGISVSSSFRPSAAPQISRSYAFSFFLSAAQQLTSKIIGTI